MNVRSRIRAAVNWLMVKEGVPRWVAITAPVLLVTISLGGVYGLNQERERDRMFFCAARAASRDADRDWWMIVFSRVETDTPVRVVQQLRQDMDETLPHFTLEQCLAEEIPGVEIPE